MEAIFYHEFKMASLLKDWRQSASCVLLSSRSSTDVLKGRGGGNTMNYPFFCQNGKYSDCLIRQDILRMSSSFAISIAHFDQQP